GCGPEQRRCLRKAHGACRRPRLKEAGQANELVPASQRRHRDRVKASRPRRKNAAGAEVKESSDRQGRVGKAGPQEEGERHRRQLLRGRSGRSSVVSHRDRPVNSKVSGKLSHRKIRRRVRMNRYNSARRRQGRLWAQLSKANRGEAHNQGLVSKQRLTPVEHRRMKRAPSKKEKGKEDRLLVASHNSSSAHSRSSGSRVARLVQPIRNRVAGSRKAGNEDHR